MKLHPAFVYVLNFIMNNMFLERRKEEGRGENNLKMKEILLTVLFKALTHQDEPKVESGTFVVRGAGRDGGWWRKVSVSLSSISVSLGPL